MGKRRNIPPPLEMMVRLPVSGSPVGQRDSDPAVPDTSQGVADWMAASARSNQPIVLRVPRGYAVLFGLLAIGLIILAYLVGRASGFSAARQKAEAEYESKLAMLASLPLDDDALAALDLNGNQEGALEQFVAEGAIDPRQIGLNYLRLAHYPSDEADRLRRFLATQGVATALDPVDNGRFYNVYAVNRGVSADELQSVGAQFKRKMKLIGQRWKQQQNGGDALETMIFVKYKGS